MNGTSTMLSKRFLHLIAFALLLSWVPFTAAADTRCATVNTDEILKNYKKANDQRKDLLAKRDQHDQRLATLVARRTKVSEAMASLREEILKQAETTEAREIYRGRADKLVNQYQSLERAINEIENLHLKQAKIDLSIFIQTSLGEIHAMIHQYARDHQYDWIIDTSGRSSSTISPLIYARDAEDITDKILQHINQ
jgi:Skp family chaperone for outer membrane proteins